MNLIQYLKNIQRDGLEIKTIYDIGANNGSWSVKLKNDFPNTSFYLFEGNEKHTNSLSATGLFYHVGILSNPGRDFVEYYKGGTSTGDSYYKENTAYYDNVVPVRMPARTLDSLVEEYKLPTPNFIKIDTQGSELDVLRGAEKLLQSVDLVYLECPIGKYNIGAPNIQEYLEYMASQNFIPSDLLEIHTADHVLVQVDLMFINIVTKDRLYGVDHNNRYINY